MTTPQQWFHDLPPVTKTWFSTSVLITLVVSLKLVSPFVLIWDFDMTFHHLQLWRLLTSFFFFGPISIGWLFQMMFLTRFGGELERNWFIGPHRTSDFAWCWILCGLALLVSGLLIPLKVYGPSLVFAMLYIWSRKSPHTPVNVWGFSFLSWHLPFVYMGLSVLMSGGLGAAIPDALGILAGHLYHFSADICPRVYNKQIIHTPSFLITLVEHTIPSVFGTPAATPARAADPDQTRAAWRRTPGHRLD